MTRDFDTFEIGQEVIVRPADHRTGVIVCRDANRLLPRWHVTIAGAMYGPYGPSDLIHPDDPDRGGWGR